MKQVNITDIEANILNVQLMILEIMRFWIKNMDLSKIKHGCVQIEKK